MVYLFVDSNDILAHSFVASLLYIGEIRPSRELCVHSDFLAYMPCI